ncbi:MAG TPA: ribonuclease P protein component [Candidatus Dormibacteraeota bacterium]|nr:ribonuclease P protein component [Candidatus Dormibacteraeota bacterium]
MRAYGSLRRTADFQRVYRRGEKAGSQHLAVYALAPRRGGESRSEVGFSIGKGVGGAVERNRLRRRFRSVLDELALDPQAGRRVVIVARPGAAELPYERLRAELGADLRRLGVA